jgi:hypothetical protein
MKSLDFSDVSPDHQATATWAAVLLHAIAREEVATRLPARLTEPGLSTWDRFKGRLTATDFVDLLFEDAAVLHRVPFSATAVDAPARVEHLPVHVVEKWLKAIPQLELSAPSADYVTEQARLLGLPIRMARSELHVVKPHQRVLELPGTGGQLAHHLVTTHNELTLQANFTIACGSWQELTLAGVVALACGAPSGDYVVRATAEAMRLIEHPLRQRSFDFVIGLAPDKGGQFKVQDQLAIWFPNAKIVLV